jgi:polyphosphate glucokinase
VAILGIDIGGSGIKGAPVDLSTGTFAEDRFRVNTPQPSDVKRVVEAVGEVADHFTGIDRFGITFPGVIIDGVVRTAANIDDSWLHANAVDLFADALHRPVTVINDADAAGKAEMAYGAGRNTHGVTMVLTFGTGIGSAIFVDGVLVPNTEFGHLMMGGKDAEVRASDHARDEEGLGWHKWAKRVEHYLQYVERLISPNLFIIGGGVSKKSDKFLPLIELSTPIVPAGLHNDAGIVGAVLAADEEARRSGVSGTTRPTTQSPGPG